MAALASRCWRAPSDSEYDAGDDDVDETDDVDDGFDSEPPPPPPIDDDDDEVLGVGEVAVAGGECGGLAVSAPIAISARRGDVRLPAVRCFDDDDDDTMLFRACIRTCE